MIRTGIILLAHDLAVAFKNKTLYLIICMPLFVYATLLLVDPAGAGAARQHLALLRAQPCAPGVVAALQQAPEQFAVRWVAMETEALQLLKAREVDGILAPDGGEAARLRLTVIQQTSPETLNLLQRLSALQSAVEGRPPGWVTAVRALQTGSIKGQTLPTWILMMVLLVSFIVLPAQIAEEKEKQLLLGWLQTPVRESTWLMAKLAYGLVLMLTAVVVLQLMSGAASCAHGMSYLVLLCVGGFCFGALGICLGLLCRNQASARTLGVLCYLPLLLPAALSDMSPILRTVAPLVPSYQFYEPLRVLLLEDGGPYLFPRAWSGLALFGLLACLAALRLIRKRWLMA